MDATALDYMIAGTAIGVSVILTASTLVTAARGSYDTDQTCQHRTPHRMTTPRIRIAARVSSR